jgi:hypothetical protein
MGNGVPLEQLRHNLLKVCSLHGLPLDKHAIDVLATVLRKENTTLIELDVSGSLGEPRAPDETRCIAHAIAHHPTLQRVRLDAAALTDLQSLRTHLEIDLSGRDVGAPATIALIAALIEANERLRVLDLTHVALDSRSREQLRHIAGGRGIEVRLDESADEARERAEHAQYARLLKATGRKSVPELLSAKELDLSHKLLNVDDARAVAKLLRESEVLTTVCGFERTDPPHTCHVTDARHGVCVRS